MAHVLFVCLLNAGRSQMSAALSERAANRRHHALSAGSDADPNGHVHPQVLEVMRELGIDLSDRRPRRLTPELESPDPPPGTSSAPAALLPPWRKRP